MLKKFRKTDTNGKWILGEDLLSDQKNTFEIETKIAPRNLCEKFRKEDFHVEMKVFYVHICPCAPDRVEIGKSWMPLRNLFIIVNI